MSVLATEDDLVKIVALLKERGVSASRRVLQGRGPVLSSCQQGCVGGGSASWTLHVDTCVSAHLQGSAFDVTTIRLASGGTGSANG